MKNKSFRLWDDEYWSSSQRSRSKGRVDIFYPDEKAMKSQIHLVIFPGGGYGTISLEEGIKTANFFSNQGIYCYVVYYRVLPEFYPAPLMDACRAMFLIKQFVLDNFENKRSKIVTLGYSAGGHLSGLLSVLKKFPDSPIGNYFLNYDSFRPDAFILIYPILSMIKGYHMTSLKNFLKSIDDLDLRNSLSIEKNLHSGIAPCFIVQAIDDRVSSLKVLNKFIKEAKKYNINSTVLLSSHGGHGFNIGDTSKEFLLHEWPKIVLNWLNSL